MILTAKVTGKKHIVSQIAEVSFKSKGHAASSFWMIFSHAMASFAQMERELIVELPRAGFTWRELGGIGGRKRKLTEFPPPSATFT